MKYVLDSSVTLKWSLPEIDSDKAERLRDEFQSASHDLLAPDVFPEEAEYRNRLFTTLDRLIEILSQISARLHHSEPPT